ncbi:peptide-methionine (S)-S-oxide reductase MsrA [Haloarchaeobius sp. FL176]|uniref:peptide-methionine (S)-S-oxide reductase MsrA n=1 Tax=Haloarchaeobius sp. FL176 TaxID=2967129 RepID=UPI002149465F|nr:peptide-methionine (S)-S-oxide reductase MsrA [Haloarchaeobius sp. FL176]
MDQTSDPASIDAAAPPPSETATATFGAGCFWGPEARFGALPGVVRTRVGYAGGNTPSPTYHSLGDHTEVVQVEYVPDQLSYEALLETFWDCHTPAATGKRQYRSVVLASDDEQLATAERVRERIAASTHRTNETAIEPLDGFTLAEAYHQKYELRSTPVLGDELVDRLGDGLVDSTVAARLNGFVAGHGDDSQRRAFLARLDLPPVVLSEVERRL